MAVTVAITATRGQGGCSTKRRRAVAALRAARPCRRARTSTSRARPSRNRALTESSQGHDRLQLGGVASHHLAQSAN